MAEIINLRIARKARARSAKDTTASANRLQFGRSGQDKRAARDEQARLTARSTVPGATPIPSLTNRKRAPSAPTAPISGCRKADMFATAIIFGLEPAAVRTSPKR